LESIKLALNMALNNMALNMEEKIERATYR
jgi:hypothetical protein